MATITKHDTRQYTSTGALAMGQLDYRVQVSAPQAGSDKQNEFAASLAGKVAESARQHILASLNALSQAVRTGKLTQDQSDSKLAEVIGMLEGKLAQAEALPLKTWLDRRISSIREI